MAVIPSEGTVLQIELVAASGTYTTIPGVLSVGGPAPEAAMVDTTNLTSTRKTFRASRIPDEGEVTFRIQYDPNDTTHQAILTKFYAGTVTLFRMKYVDGLATNAKVDFSSVITNVEESDKEFEDSNVEMDVTVKVTGSATRTAGSA